MALDGYLLSVLFFTLILSHTCFFILSRETFFVNDRVHNCQGVGVG